MNILLNLDLQPGIRLIMRRCLSLFDDSEIVIVVAVTLTCSACFIADFSVNSRPIFIS